MYFVTGGAFNGKGKWVKEAYQLAQMPYLWVSAYQGEQIPVHWAERIVVLEGLEIWLKEWVSPYTTQEIREKWRARLQDWLKWEKEDSGRKLILIGTDISKGIVPVLAEERKWRDITGWAYQDAVIAAERADVIWYGVNQNLK